MNEDMEGPRKSPTHANGNTSPGPRMNVSIGEKMNRKHGGGEASAKEREMKDSEARDENETIQLKEKSEPSQKKRQGSARLFALCINSMRDKKDVVQTPKRGQKSVVESNKTGEATTTDGNTRSDSKSQKTPTSSQRGGKRYTPQHINQEQNIERYMQSKCVISQPSKVVETPKKYSEENSSCKVPTDAAEALILSWSPENIDFTEESERLNYSEKSNGYGKKHIETIKKEDGHLEIESLQKKNNVGSSNNYAKEHIQLKTDSKKLRQRQQYDRRQRTETYDSTFLKSDKRTGRKDSGKSSGFNVQQEQRTRDNRCDKKKSNKVDRSVRDTKKLFAIRKDFGGENWENDLIKLTETSDRNIPKVETCLLTRTNDTDNVISSVETLDYKFQGCSLLNRCDNFDLAGILEQSKTSLLHVETGRGIWQPKYGPLWQYPSPGQRAGPMTTQSQTSPFCISPPSPTTPRGMKRRRSCNGDTEDLDDKGSPKDGKGEQVSKDTPKKLNLDSSEIDDKQISGDELSNSVQKKKSLLLQDFDMARELSMNDSVASSSSPRFQDFYCQSPHKALKMSPGASMIHYASNFPTVLYSPNVQGYRPPTPHNATSGLSCPSPMTNMNAEGHRFRGDIFSYVQDFNYYRDVPPPGYFIDSGYEHDSQCLPIGQTQVEESSGKPKSAEQIAGEEQTKSMANQETTEQESADDKKSTKVKEPRRRSIGLLQIASSYVELDDESEEDFNKCDQENKAFIEKCSTIKLNTPSPSPSNRRYLTSSEMGTEEAKKSQEKKKLSNAQKRTSPSDSETPKHPHSQNRNKKGGKNKMEVAPKQLFAKSESQKVETKQSKQFVQSTGAVLAHLRKGEEKKNDKPTWSMMGRGVGRGVLNGQLTRNKSMSAMKPPQNISPRDSITRRRSEPDVSQSSTGRQTTKSTTEQEKTNSGNEEIDWFENNASGWKRCKVGQFQLRTSVEHKESPVVENQESPQTDNSSSVGTPAYFWMQKQRTPSYSSDSSGVYYTPPQNYQPLEASKCQSVDVVDKAREKVVPEWRRRSFPLQIQNQNDESPSEHVPGSLTSGQNLWRNAWKTRLKQKYDNVQGKYIDSHCHIDFIFNRTPFKGSFAKFMQINSDTWPASFKGCIAVFCDPRTFSPRGGLWKDVLSEPNVWGAIGCHPKSAVDFHEYTEENLKKMMLHPKVKALGEIGLDYSGTFYQHSEVQKNVFERQIQIGLAANKPLVIHSRDSESDCVEILEKLVPRNYKIHRHCFTGDWSEAENWLRKFPNSYIGLTPLITYPRGERAKAPREVAARIPLNKLLLETDAPYFTPGCVPKAAMKLSHPGMAITVADEVARLQGVTLEEVLEATLQNTQNMYNLTP